MNGGTCVEGHAHYDCECVTGWEGVHCEIGKTIRISYFLQVMKGFRNGCHYFVEMKSVEQSYTRFIIVSTSDQINARASILISFRNLMIK